MFRNIVFSAFGAALAVAIVVSALQFVTTEPLILHAEQFEGGGHGHDHAAAAHTASKAEAVLRLSFLAEADEALLLPVHSVTEGEDEWGPAGGLERSLYSVLANLVIGFAGTLMLLGAMMAKGEPVDARRGLLWGLGAFLALSLLPAFGLPPELPGTPAAELADRQIWWLGTAAASGLGIGLLAFGRSPALVAAGIALIASPHVVGAPEPPSHDVTYPGALAGEFVTASLVVSLVLWSLAGSVGGWLHQRLSREVA
jgi:cobalt transporter subunit CbtA